MADSSQTTGSWFAFSGCIPQEGRHHACDITLVVEDGKEFKAHRRVLSEASPFFEKLFNSDMKESNEGVVRLEMPTELGMKDILEFIYTGSVHVSDANIAQELIVMADYLDLPHLKTLAERFLLDNLNVSNVISTCFIAEKCRSEELISESKSFILTSFNNVAKMEEFLNLSNEEVKIWISSDEINVSSEEDVFRIILNWIDHEKSERKKYFAELFREVRLVYVSRDFLLSEIMTNDLVNDNEGCMDLVKNAMKFVDPKDYFRLGIRPRKSLENPVLVVRIQILNLKDQVLCYNLREKSWSRFRELVPPGPGKIVSCHGNFFFVLQNKGLSHQYDSLSNRWASLTFLPKKRVEKVFFTNENEIYAWVTEKRTLGPDYDSPVCKVHSGDHDLFDSHRRTICLSFITKYKPETNSWEDITSFDLGAREGVCVVAKGNFIYFVGGVKWWLCRYVLLSYADKYDLDTNTWDEIAHLQERRGNASGAAAHGKIFIAGGESHEAMPSCEVYSETTNTWQYTKGLISYDGMMPVEGKLYNVQNCLIVLEEMITQHGVIVKCYDPDSNQWNEVTQIPLEMLSLGSTGTDCYVNIKWFSMRSFAGWHCIAKTSSV